jgi:hypothetical protein
MPPFSKQELASKLLILLRSGVRDRVFMWDFVVDKVALGQVF